MANIRIKNFPAFTGTIPNDAVFALETNSATQKVDFATLKASISGGSASGDDVVFYDYDGNVVESYSAVEFASLSELPAAPDHTADGLTAQGWNWSLSDAKAYVAEYGALEIGQTYITTDGKTHIHIHLDAGRISPMLCVCPDGTVDVDWGDNTAHDTLTGTSTSTVQWTPAHSYAAPGDYVIKLDVTGSMGFYSSGSGFDNNSGPLRYTTNADTRNYPYMNAIRAVFIGSGVTSIADYAFLECLSIKNVTIPNSVTSIGEGAFSQCTSLKSITIPSGVTSINGACYNCTRLSSAAMPKGITSLGGAAFQSCGLLRVTIPSSVTNIEDHAFQYCYALRSAILPGSVTSIEEGAFDHCSSLSDITIPGSVTSIGEYAFNDCFSLADVTIQNGVTEIGYGAFGGCENLRSITIPNSVTDLYGGVFSGCSALSSAALPAGLTTIYGGLFYVCHCLENITIPNSVTTILSGAFGGCTALSTINIPNGVTSIDGYAFEECYNLTSVTIPGSVTSIGDRAFRQCFGVSEYHVQATTPPTLGSNVFNSIASDCIIYVPASSVSAYKGASGWSAFSSRIQAEPT